MPSRFVLGARVVVPVLAMAYMVWHCLKCLLGWSPANRCRSSLPVTFWFLALGVPMVVFPIWEDRRFARRVTTSAEGLQVDTAGGPTFRIAWGDISELAEYRLRRAYEGWERCLRLRTSDLPYLMLTSRLDGFDELRALVQSSAPQARRVERSRFERIVMYALPLRS